MNPHSQIKKYGCGKRKVCKSVIFPYKTACLPVNPSLLKGVIIQTMSAIIEEHNNPNRNNLNNNFKSAPIDGNLIG